MAEEKDWADEYDPTNPDGPEPKNMQRTDPIADLIEKHGMPAGPMYDPMRTNKGPVGFVPAAPQIDPMPYAVPPNMNPNVEIRNNEGPFFGHSDRRGGTNNANRDISDYLQNMMSPADSRIGSPWRSIDMNDWVHNADHMPSGRLPDDRMMDPYYKPVTPMGRDLGTADLDKYNQTYRLPNFRRDDKLANDNSNYSDEITLRGMPEYMRKDAAAELAKDAMDSKLESEVVWEGKHGAPTEGDIDKVLANPTDGMYQMFEDQFGVEAMAKAFPEAEEDVPLPKPRPKSAPKRK